MSKRALVQPKWLDEMLWRWGIRSLRLESRALGYPSICPMLKEGIPVQAQSFEPTGYSEEDFSQLERAVSLLVERHQMALIRAYRPWKARDIEETYAAYGVTTRTWQRWVHEAAGLINASMNRQAKGIATHEPLECR
ncbi:hypothetical protein [Methylibium sp.]|uniref:hypothetical protein n=1 Tax=Methylibium sp. TaxID=2067992 RepID=UPI003BAB73D5